MSLPPIICDDRLQTVEALRRRLLTSTSYSLTQGLLLLFRSTIRYSRVPNENTTDQEPYSDPSLVRITQANNLEGPTSRQQHHYLHESPQILELLNYKQKLVYMKA